MSKLVTFGELMGRLAPPGHLRFAQSLPGSLEFTFAGAEANVAVSFAVFGGTAAFVTALPDNPLTDCALATLRGFGVDTRFVRRTPAGRFGLYFVETGANQRPGRVVYDREHASINQLPFAGYDFSGAFHGAEWFHFTGITPALSEAAAEATRAAANEAKSRGLTVSCDLNFRKTLWKWGGGRPARELAAEVMSGLLPYVDVLIANEADAEDVLGIRAGKSQVNAGELDLESYPTVARALIERFPNVKKVAITLRESISASHNNWGGMLYDAEADRAWFAPLVNSTYAPYEIRNIVDRVGAGDSFAGALIYALAEAFPGDPASCVGFAAAASCLAHSVRGDFNLNSFAEVEALRLGDASGRVQR